MNDDQFTKLFKFVTDVDHKLDGVVENMATKDDIRRLESPVDKAGVDLDAISA